MGKKRKAVPTRPAPAGRRIIFECRIGSHLYGTARPESDEDFAGVFLPSVDDYVGMGDDGKGMGHSPTEWQMNVKSSDGPRNAKGDVDRKYFSLARFMALAAEGQPGQLEFLFAPPEMVLTSSPEWEEILKNRHLFLSRGGVEPLFGFALAQAKKAHLKAENFNKLEALIRWGKALPEKDRARPLYKLAQVEWKDEAAGRGVMVFKIPPRPPKREESAASRPAKEADPTRDVLARGFVDTSKVSPQAPTAEEESAQSDIETVSLAFAPNEAGYVVFTLPGGGDYDFKIKTRLFLKSAEALKGRYGSRSKDAAAKGLDYKSLSHAYRLLFETEEFLRTGEITLPLPAEERAIMLRVRLGELGPKYPYFKELEAGIARLRKELLPHSPLPLAPDREKIEALCRKLMKAHLFRELTRELGGSASSETPARGSAPEEEEEV